MNAGGHFITFEGIDFAGKSSHIQPMADLLTQSGFEVVVTREPGGTPLAERLRELILHQEMDAMTETLLAFAARRDHLERVIVPALKQGKVVLCDRFTDSTVAYQGYGKGFDGSEHMLPLLEHWVQKTEAESPVLQPDLTLWFDLDPEIAAARSAGAQRQWDRFDSQSPQFFSRVRLGYFTRSAASRVIRIEADQPVERVAEDVGAAVHAYIWGAKNAHTEKDSQVA